MRMWMIDPNLMCTQHIVGEHGEIHKHRHNFVKGHSIKGRKGQIEPLSMKTRHDELTKYLKNHKSPYEMPDLSKYSKEDMFTVDLDKSIEDLKIRCPECRKKIRDYYKNSQKCEEAVIIDQ